MVRLAVTVVGHGEMITAGWNPERGDEGRVVPPREWRRLGVPARARLFRRGGSPIRHPATPASIEAPSP